MYVQSLYAIPWRSGVLETFGRSIPWLGNVGDCRVNRESAGVIHQIAYRLGARCRGSALG